MSARVLLLAVHFNLYFDSHCHCHSLQFEYAFSRGLLHVYHNAWNKSNGDTEMTTNL